LFTDLFFYTKITLRLGNAAKFLFRLSSQSINCKINGTTDATVRQLQLTQKNLHQVNHPNNEVQEAATQTNDADSFPTLFGFSSVTVSSYSPS